MSIRNEIRGAVRYATDLGYGQPVPAFAPCRYCGAEGDVIDSDPWDSPRCEDRVACGERRTLAEHGAWRPVPALLHPAPGSIDQQQKRGGKIVLETYCVRCGVHVSGGLFVENARVKGRRITWVVDHPDRHGCTMRPRAESTATRSEPAPIADPQLAVDWNEAPGGLQAAAFPEFAPTDPKTGRAKPEQLALL